jgi:hypothetical protein
MSSFSTAKDTEQITSLSSTVISLLSLKEMWSRKKAGTGLIKDNVAVRIEIKNAHTEN